MSATSMAHIDFDRASAEDYDELMSMSIGFHKGMDYLPFRYHEWLKDHRRHMFVAKSEGKIVGFRSFLLVDGGSTAVLQGLRVAPWMRGKGITRRIHSFCIDRIRSDHPQVKKVRLIRAEENPAKLLDIYKLIDSKAMVPLFLPSDKLEEGIALLEARLAEAGQSVSYKVLEPAEVLQLFDGTKIAEDLLPQGLLVQEWIPLTTHRSNLEMLFERRIVWIYSPASDASGSLALSDENSTDGQQTNHETLMSRESPSTHQSSAGFLSLGTPAYPVAYTNTTHAFHLDMFGIDPACLRVHVVEQIKRCVQSLPAGRSLISFMYVEKILRDKLIHLCEGLTPFLGIRDQMILEIDI